MTDAIRGFQGEYRFLSNFYIAPITYWTTDGDEVYPASENVYQAWKLRYSDLSADAKDDLRISFRTITPGEAKRLGRSIPLITSLWNGTVSFNAMSQVVRHKFTQHPELVKLLLATGDAELIEENNWGDKVWGTVNGVGQNQLGKILMDERDHWWAESLRTTTTPPLEVT